MAKRILIADDSLTIQKAFAMTFGGEDASLVVARSADEGLMLARQSRPDLVIADAVMPGRSGYDLCSAVKTDPALRGIPVYILASAQNPYDEALGRQSGVDGQFIKPFDSVALVEKVNDAIARAASVVAFTPPPVVAPSSAAASPRPSMTPVVSPPGMPGMPSRPSASPSPSPSLRSMPPSATEPDDDYGEISIDPFGPRDAPLSGGESPADLATAQITPPPVAPPAPLAPVVHAAPRSPGPAAPMNPPGVMRPSLIPGLRPGAVTAARPLPMRPPFLPGSVHPGSPNNPPGSVNPSTSATSAPATQRGPTSPPIATGPARTLVGLPAAVAHPPARFGGPTAPARPATQPVRPLDSHTPPLVSRSPGGPGGAPGGAPGSSPPLPAAPSLVDQRVAAIAARGPEYEALAKLSREIIEKIVWEIVPGLTEVIVREELQKRGRV